MARQVPGNHHNLGPFLVPLVLRRSDLLAVVHHQRIRELRIRVGLRLVVVSVVRRLLVAAGPFLKPAGSQAWGLATPRSRGGRESTVTESCVTDYIRSPNKMRNPPSLPDAVRPWVIASRTAARYSPKSSLVDDTNTEHFFAIARDYSRVNSMSNKCPVRPAANSSQS